MKVGTSKKPPDATVNDERETAPAAVKVRMVMIDSGADGQRIDNYLVTALKGVPKSHIYRLLRKGEVRVNKARAKPQYRLQKGDVIRIPPVRTAEPKAAGQIPRQRLQQLGASVLYEDADLLVLNKPSGWAVHGGSGVPYGVIEALRELRTDLPEIELAHRLDRDTSGCLLLAKNRITLNALHNMLRDGTIEKNYLALVKGRWPASLKRVDVALKKNVLRSGERVVTGDVEGKESQTEFRVRNAFRNATLVEARLLTGRTHQVRVHAAHVGHPLAGDDKYGDADFNKLMRRSGLKRLFLHACSLRLTVPGSGKLLSLQAPLPAELDSVLDALKHDGA